MIKHFKIIMLAAIFSAIADQAVLYDTLKAPEDVSFVESTKAKIQNGIALVEASFLRSNTGYATPVNVSHEMEQFVRQIIAELGLENELAQVPVVKSNLTIAMVAVIFNSYYIVINEPYFADLADNQKRAIIAHEIIHYRNNHLNKKRSLSIALSIAPLAGLWIAYKTTGKDWLGIFDQSFLRLNWPRTKGEFLNRIAFGLTTGISSTLIEQWAARHYEYEADAESAHAIKDYDALISWLELEKDDQKNETSVAKFFRKIMSTHPDNDERIAHLKKEKERFIKSQTLKQTA